MNVPISVLFTSGLEGRCWTHPSGVKVNLIKGMGCKRMVNQQRMQGVIGTGVAYEVWAIFGAN